MSEHSRRTVVRGAAWSVPVIAVAAQAPAFATSHPGRPIVNFSLACANTGTVNKGCGTPKALQVPLTVDNSLGTSDIVFQITSMFTSNGNTAPTAADALVDPDIAVGVDRIVGTTAGFANQNVCNLTTASACTGGVTNGTIVVPKLTTGTFFIVANSTGNSSKFSSTINFRLLTTDCKLIEEGTAQTPKAISPNNCGNAPSDPPTPK